MNFEDFLTQASRLLSRFLSTARSRTGSLGTARGCANTLSEGTIMFRRWGMKARGFGLQTRTESALGSLGLLLFRGRQSDRPRLAALLFLISIFSLSCLKPVSPAGESACVPYCKRVAELGCPEGEPSKGGRSCVDICENYHAVGYLRPYNDCGAKAKTVADLRSCGLACASKPLEEGKTNAH